jgi:hypothetical protein
MIPLQFGIKLNVHDDHTLEDLERMIIGLSVPRILNFSQQKDIIDSLPVKEHVLLFVKDDQDIASRILIDTVNQINGQFHGRLLFISVNSSEISVVWPFFIFTIWFIYSQIYVFSAK